MIPFKLNPLGYQPSMGLKEYLQETPGTTQVTFRKGTYTLKGRGGGGAGGEDAGGAGGTAELLDTTFTLAKESTVTIIVGDGGKKRANGGNGGAGGGNGDRYNQGTNGGGGNTSAGGGGGFPTLVLIDGTERKIFYKWIGENDITLLTATKTPTISTFVFVFDFMMTRAVYSPDWEVVKIDSENNVTFKRKSDDYTYSFTYNSQVSLYCPSVLIANGGGGGGGGGRYSTYSRYASGGGGGGGGGRYILDLATLTGVSIPGQPGAGGGKGNNSAWGNSGVAGDTTNFPDISSGQGGWSVGQGGSGQAGGGASGGGGGGSTGNNSSATAGGGGGGAGGDADAGGGSGGAGGANWGASATNSAHTTATPSTNWQGETSTLGQGGNRQQAGYNGWVYIKKN